MSSERDCLRGSVWGWEADCAWGVGISGARELGFDESNDLEAHPFGTLGGEVKVGEPLEGFAFSNHERVQVVDGNAGGGRDGFAHRISGEHGSVVTLGSKRVVPVRGRRCGGPDDMGRNRFEVFQHGSKARAELFISDARWQAVESVIVMNEGVIAVFQFFAKSGGGGIVSSNHAEGDETPDIRFPAQCFHHER